MNIHPNAPLLWQLSCLISQRLTLVNDDRQGGARHRKLPYPRLVPFMLSPVDGGKRKGADI